MLNKKKMNVRKEFIKSYKLHNDYFKKFSSNNKKQMEEMKEEFNKKKKRIDSRKIIIQSK